MSEAIATPPERLAYPVAEACILGGFGRTKLYELIKSNELRTVRRAGRRLVLKADLEAFLTGVAA
ncbi:MAG TPA: helix-turn-helix domain-containing protein [Caulobacteraceae bacterium]|nr:helix-turn-helix domain-containing protein [Caulobacteraceae bacterium]